VVTNSGLLAGKNSAVANFLPILALLETARYREAELNCLHLTKAVLSWSERDRLVLGGLRGIALYGLNADVEAEPLLRRVWESNVIAPKVLIVLATKLQKIGHPIEAKRVLLKAVELDPLDEVALVSLLNVSVTLDKLEDVVPKVSKLLTMRKPSKDLLVCVALALTKDKYQKIPGVATVVKDVTTYVNQKSPVW
jgi:hypothetical protein